MTTREVFVLVAFDGHPKGSVFSVAYDTTEQRTRVNDLIHKGMLTIDAAVLASRKPPTEPAADPQPATQPMTIPEQRRKP